MKIESIIKREGGTRVSLSGTNYHFKPDEEGRHVADVEQEAHVERFLSIPEGYRLAPSAAVAPAKPTKPPVKLTTITPVATDVDHGAEGIDAGKSEDHGSDAAKASPADDKQPEADELDAAKTAYIEKFGKKPHHTWSAELISKKIAEG